MKKVFFDWELGVNFGWGLLGLNLFSRFANDKNYMPLMGRFIEPEHIMGLDPFFVNELIPSFQNSNEYLSKVMDKKDPNLKDVILISGLGNGFKSDTPFFSDRQIGRPIFEDTSSLNNIHLLDSYDELLVASNWSKNLLTTRTQKKVYMIPEGVDHSLFCIGKKSQMLPAGNFYIFSGGKVEYRKGQDLVLEVFRRFSKKYTNAKLVVAWQSLWPQVSVGMKGIRGGELSVNEGMLNIKKWAQDNGVDPYRVIDLGFVPNQMMPRLLREMDASLQLSRAEACSNLPLMEAMACGIPVVASLNTGLLDLLNNENSIPIEDQFPVDRPHLGTEGWGEANLDEAYNALEKLYLDRNFATDLGLKGSQWLIENGYTWDAHVAQLKNLLSGV